MTDFLSPVGRLVQGSPFKPQTTDMAGQPLVFKSGPSKGLPRVQFFAAVAFRKDDLAFPAFRAIIQGVGAAGFPHLFPQGGAGPCTHPRFAFKIIDGDGVDDNGKQNATKDGFAGHWVVRFSSGFAPQVCPTGRYGAVDRISDPAMLRAGYFVRIAGSAESNGDASKPGVFVNMNMVELCGYGPEILQGPDAATVFGRVAAVLPPGASAAPLGAGTAAPSQTAPAAAVNSMPATASPTNPPPAGQYTAYMAPPPPAPAAPPAPPAAPTGPVMTAKAGGNTYEAFRSQGWTDDAMRQQGYLV